MGSTEWGSAVSRVTAKLDHRTHLVRAPGMLPLNPGGCSQHYHSSTGLQTLRLVPWLLLSWPQCCHPQNEFSSISSSLFYKFPFQSSRCVCLTGWHRSHAGTLASSLRKWDSGLFWFYVWDSSAIKRLNMGNFTSRERKFH